MQKVCNRTYPTSAPKNVTLRSTPTLRFSFQVLEIMIKEHMQSGVMWNFGYQVLTMTHITLIRDWPCFFFHLLIRIYYIFTTPVSDCLLRFSHPPIKNWWERVQVWLGVRACSTASACVIVANLYILLCEIMTALFYPCGVVISSSCTTSSISYNIWQNV